MGSDIGVRCSDTRHPTPETSLVEHARAPCTMLCAALRLLTQLVVECQFMARGKNQHTHTHTHYQLGIQAMNLHTYKYMPEEQACLLLSAGAQGACTHRMQIYQTDARSLLHMHTHALGLPRSVIVPRNKSCALTFSQNRPSHVGK
eukprot:1141629-Pelagomonas_calceolata.AAC.1